jgi:hypothetical protein
MTRRRRTLARELAEDLVAGACLLVALAALALLLVAMVPGA